MGHSCAGLPDAEHQDRVRELSQLRAHAVRPAGGHGADTLAHRPPAWRVSGHHGVRFLSVPRLVYQCGVLLAEHEAVSSGCNPGVQSRVEHDSEAKKQKLCR